MARTAAMSEVAELALAVAEWSSLAIEVSWLLTSRPDMVTWTEQALALELQADPMDVLDAIEELHLAGAITPARDQQGGWRRA